MRSEISHLRRREAPADLTDDILIALQREARRKALAARRRADMVDMWRLRLFSQSVGTVVSLALFVMMTASVFRPAYRALQSDLLYRQMLIDQTPPVFNPSGAVLGFTESLSEDGIVITLVKVQQDGRASVKEAVAPSSDLQIVHRLSNALFRQASFQPTRRKPRNADAVLMFSKINISG